MLTIWVWAYVASFREPLFLIATLVFVVGVFMIGRRTTSVTSAAEFGVLFGYVYGVAVWGSLGYHFDLSSYTKMLVAGAVIVDALYLTVIVRAVFQHLDTAEAIRIDAQAPSGASHS